MSNVTHSSAMSRTKFDVSAIRERIEEVVRIEKRNKRARLD
jgi:hypothetical protein